MSTIFFISNLSQGGSQKICATLLNQGIANDVLLLNDSERAFSIPNSIKVYSLNRKSAFRAIFPLLKFILYKKPSKILVFNHQLALCLLFVRFFFQLDFRIIARTISTLSKKEQEEKSWYRKYIVYPLIKKYYGKSNVIICQSNGMMEDLKSYLNGPLDCDLETIYNPVTPCIKTLRYRNKNGHELEVMRGFLFAGRLEKVKGIQFLLNSYLLYTMSCEKENRSPEKLYIFGNGSLENLIRAFIEDNLLTELVELHDFRNDFLLAARDCRCFLLTSIYEGFPNAMAEAIASGIPAISLDIESGPREIIKDGINGYLVKNRNEEVFSKYMMRFNYIDSEVVANSMSKFNTKDILKSYSEILRN
ncbi:hypothetical protein BCU72_15020 [Vibrio cyclitrophicus]|uniref:glycosyltransferase n=1 Tax=Vibrio cyclitrophicus TaxID=47951 RepID=UPI0002E585AA|nr:glycosyltransferase [Vibrio cyclitrophicus]OEF32101.1 hypothetical protein OA7_16325 [Vibrio cyclitrophicus 1F53]PMH33111.1 hypothetical protein BCU72_15020 [Vibrio cyclitrophicus]